MLYIYMHYVYMYTPTHTQTWSRLRQRGLALGGSEHRAAPGDDCNYYVLLLPLV